MSTSTDAFRKKCWRSCGGFRQCSRQKQCSYSDALACVAPDAHSGDIPARTIYCGTRRSKISTEIFLRWKLRCGTFAQPVDLIVIGGDVLPGPMPSETIACLLDLETPVEYIRGNGEAAVVAELTGQETARLPEQAREVVRWVGQQLDPEQRRLIASWPPSFRVEIRGLGEFLFCHATPRNDTEISTRLTLEENLLPVFQALKVSVVVCGHTHMQFDRTIGKTRVVNAGSVGMPFGEAGADWVLLGPDVELRHTAYNLTQAADRIRATKYPQAESFAANNVLKPPSAEEMLNVFTRAELKD